MFVITVSLKTMVRVEIKVNNHNHIQIFGSYKSNTKIVFRDT